MASKSGLAKQRRAVTKLWLAWRLPLVVVVVVAAAGGGGYYAWTSFEQAREQAAEQQTQGQGQEILRRFSGVVSNALSGIRESLDLNRAADLISAGDSAAMQAYAGEIAASRSEVIGARLLPVDVSEVDYEVVPPVSYATLDLVRRTREAGEEQPAEVHFFGDERQHLALLVPVPAAGDAAVGFVLIGVGVELIESAASAVALEPGARLLVQQVVPGATSVDLVELGGTAPRTEAALSMRVSGTTWRLRYWLPGGEVSQATEEESLLSLPLVGALAAVVLLGVAVVLMRRRRKPARRSTPGESTREENIDDLLSDKLAALSAVIEGDDLASPAAESGLEVDEGDEGDGPARPAEPAEEIPASIFRAYDIRGVVGQTLTPDVVRSLGRAIGSEAFDRSQQTVVVGYDGRTSSPELAAALVEGLRASGRDVIDIGRVPTPVLYFATHHLETGTGVMVTGSHNPPQYNGLKIMVAGETLYGERIGALRERLAGGEISSGEGTLQQMDVTGDYIRRVTEDIPVALGSAYKIVVDCGNGIAGEVAPKLLRGLGHDVIELHCEVDGSFPNHHPDPSQPENLADLIGAVKKNGADIGFAFDGDGDRLGVVDGSGRVLWPDLQMMLFARDVLSRHAGATVVFDVKCTSRLPRVVEKLGGRPVMWKTGHSLLKAKMNETKALLAGEMSGHVFFKDRWYGFDDAMYAAARMVEILMAIGAPPAQVFAKLPSGLATPELRIDLDEGEPTRFMSDLMLGDRFPGAEITTIDGLRADYQDAWGLVRASNTTPSLVLRFEGDNQAALDRIQGEFRQALLEIDAGLALPF